MYARVRVNRDRFVVCHAITVDTNCAWKLTNDGYNNLKNKEDSKLLSLIN